MPLTSVPARLGALAVATMMTAGLRALPAEAGALHPVCGTLDAIAVDGVVLCVHGDDDQIRGAYAGMDTAALQDDHKLACTTTDGPTVQVLWARTAVGNKLTSERRASIDAWTAGAQGVFDNSARAHGVSVARLPRVLADKSCTTTDITEVVMTATAMSDFATMLSELRDKGFTARDRVYLIYADSTAYCGIATLYRDDSPDPATNRSAVRPAAGYARVDQSCVTYAEAHELAHTFGAVQNTAPNSTDFGHCNDGHDVMCYADGSPNSNHSTSRCHSSWRLMLDCGRDDYYNPRALVGGYLASHWNIADSPFLFDAPTGATETGGFVDGVADLTAGVQIAGDFDGDGTDDLGWYHDGAVALRRGNGTVLRYQYGQPGDVPIVADFDGDGVDTVSIVRDGTWHINNRQADVAPQRSFVYGRVTSGDVPFAGDFDGDGTDSVAIVRDGEWHLRNTVTGGRAEIVFIYGRVRKGDIPAAGDWNGDGADTVAVVRGTDWHLRDALAGGPADRTFRYGNTAKGDRTVVGNWDGVGGDSTGIVREASWHLRNDLRGGPATQTMTFAG